MTVSVSVAGVALLARLSMLMSVGLGVQAIPRGPHTGARHEARQAFGADRTVTFDRDLKTVDSFRLL